jgi:hypothetical protein
MMKSVLERVLKGPNLEQTPDNYVPIDTNLDTIKHA